MMKIRSKTSGRKFNVDNNDNTKIDKITGHIENCEPRKQLKIVNVDKSSEISKTFESNNMSNSKKDVALQVYGWDEMNKISSSNIYSIPKSIE